MRFTVDSMPPLVAGLSSVAIWKMKRSWLKPHPIPRLCWVWRSSADRFRFLRSLTGRPLERLPLHLHYLKLNTLLQSIGLLRLVSCYFWIHERTFGSWWFVCLGRCPGAKESADSCEFVHQHRNCRTYFLRRPPWQSSQSWTSSKHQRGSLWDLVQSSKRSLERFPDCAEESKIFGSSVVFLGVWHTK